jgi:hypothetical protein
VISIERGAAPLSARVKKFSIFFIFLLTRSKIIGQYAPFYRKGDLISSRKTRRKARKNASSVDKNQRE